MQACWPTLAHTVPLLGRGRQVWMRMNHPVPPVVPPPVPLDILQYCQNQDAVARVIAHRRRIAALLDRGVIIPCPESIEVDADVDPSRITPGVVLHSGTKLSGSRTFLASGVRLGAEGPVTLHNCVLGPDVVLDGGFFTGATFLDRANARSWAHMREGTLLEEEASVAHCVGLKQTILFPFVTLGSLINFCDCLMAGGTSRKNHSEVGSGYIHFNYTPRGEKATPSLFGDVPRGVLLDQPRIFLGGLGATVGPTSVGYGSFLGPGQVYRREVGEGQNLLGEPPIPLNVAFDPQRLTGIRQKLRRNLRYIGNLAALWQWYVHARALFERHGERHGERHRERLAPPHGDPHGGTYSTTYAILYAEVRAVIAAAITTRVAALHAMMQQLPPPGSSTQLTYSGEIQSEHELLARIWPSLHLSLQSWRSWEGDLAARDRLLGALQGLSLSHLYLEGVRHLTPPDRGAAEQWLKSVVGSATELLDQAR